jgi:hypothetical protein
MSHDNKEELSACYARLEDMDQRWQKACKERDAANAQIERLKRGEYICAKCGLRKDGEGERGDF